MNIMFWQGKKVLVTGHTGFKGSWLSLWLQRMGTDVVGYSLYPPSNPSLFEIANVAEGMVSLHGDIRELDSLTAAIAEYQPEIVIHMAAQALVRNSYSNPVDTYSSNIMGTVNVLEAVRQSDCVRVLLNITSDKCYENREWLWGYRENEPMGGHDPYSSSKGCAELVTAAYRRSYFSDNNDSEPCVSVSTTRAGNVIGGGDWAQDRLVPDIMNALLENRPPFIRYKHAVRPWQFVLEPLRGYLTLAEKMWESGKEYSGGWNFGPNDEDARPVSWITDNLTRFWGKGARWESDSSQQPHEANYLKLDCSKAKSLLAISPRVDLETALQWIVEWYQAYAQNEDMREVTEMQIARYEDMTRE